MASLSLGVLALQQLELLRSQFSDSLYTTPATGTLLATFGVTVAASVLRYLTRAPGWRRPAIDDVHIGFDLLFASILLTAEQWFSWAPPPGISKIPTIAAGHAVVVVDRLLAISFIAQILLAIGLLLLFQRYGWGTPAPLGLQQKRKGRATQPAGERRPEIRPAAVLGVLLAGAATLFLSLQWSASVHVYAKQFLRIAG